MEKGELGAPYDARSIANKILDLADEIGARLTQLQLYKILYFAHGWYLATEQKKLVEQDFQAWGHGPVVRVVRDAFKDFGKYPITNRADRLDIMTGELTKLDNVTSEADVKFLEKIVHFYHAYDGWELSDMTHETGSPWDIVWNPAQPTGNLGLRIDQKLIEDHFSKLPNRFRLN